MKIKLSKIKLFRISSLTSGILQLGRMNKDNQVKNSREVVQIIFAIIVIVVLAAVGYFLLKGSSGVRNSTQVPTEKTTEHQEVQIKASFAIFTNGTFRTFTADRYHNLSEEVFLTPNSPNTVTVTKTGITWKEFFNTLPMEVTKDCLTTGLNQTFCTNDEKTLKFYLNGERYSSALEKEIEDGDKLLVSYGNESDQEIFGQIQRIPEPK